MVFRVGSVWRMTWHECTWHDKTCHAIESERRATTSSIVDIRKYETKQEKSTEIGCFASHFSWTWENWVRGWGKKNLRNDIAYDSTRLDMTRVMTGQVKLSNRWREGLAGM